MKELSEVTEIQWDFIQWLYCEKLQSFPDMSHFRVTYKSHGNTDTTSGWPTWIYTEMVEQLLGTETVNKMTNASLARLNLLRSMYSKEFLRSRK